MVTGLVSLGQLGDRLAAGQVADVVLPVGSGRRRFLQRLLALVRDRELAHGLLLVVARDDLVPLWSRDLAAALDPEPVALLREARSAGTEPAVLIAAGRDMSSELADALEGRLLVIDEPDLLDAASSGLQALTTGRSCLRLWLRRSDTDEDGADVTMLSRYDQDLGRLVAGLIDGELERRTPQSSARWAAQILGCLPSETWTIRRRLSGAPLDLLAYRIGAALEQATEVSDASGAQSVIWRTLELPDSSAMIPDSLRAHFPAGALLRSACTVEIEQHASGGSVVGIVTGSDRAHRGAARFFAEQLAGTHHPDHPYRGHVLDVSVADGELAVRAIQPPTDKRDDLVLPEQVWQDIDRNIHGLLRNSQLLASLGLGVNRGLLLHGPPGTGKTQLVRTIVAELHGQVTAVLLRPEAMRSRLADAYQLAEQLAPSIVALEDADLIVGDRAGGDSSALVEFLTSVDGLMTEHTGVLTLATTNAPDAFDPAALRAARFDLLIELPNPPAIGRHRIWERYLSGFAGTFDIERLVRASAGASGADIREIVRRAVLDTDGDLTTSILADLAHQATTTPAAYGQYL